MVFIDNGLDECVSCDNDGVFVIGFRGQEIFLEFGEGLIDIIEFFSDTEV